MAPGEVELAVRDYGGTGRQIVLVHGLSSNLAIWDLVAEQLARRFRVVAYDQRSHGRSARGDGDFGWDALVRDLEAVVHGHALMEPVVVGHSWGASVALAYAAAHPECPGVVCVDGGMFDMQAAGATWEQTEVRLRPPKLMGPEAEIIELIRSMSVLPWKLVEPVVRRGRIATEDGLTRPRLAFDDHMTIVRMLWEQSTGDLYGRVRCPVLLVPAAGGDEGWVAAKRKATEQLRQRHGLVRVEWVESVHDVPLAKPDELAALIDAFVTSVSAPE